MEEFETHTPCRRDRRDAWYIQQADTMHRFMPYLMPKRCDNEAVLGIEIDLNAIEKFLETKNTEDTQFKYTFFHVICAAFAATTALRPKLNRFYKANRYYERKDISLSFVVKKQFSDNASEALAIVKVEKESDTSPLEQIHSQVEKIVHATRKEGKDDGATDDMAKLLVLPRPLLKFVVWILNRLDYHDLYPASFMKEDPYYTSFFVSNLGSIKMDADYHHLAEWGTNSVFAVIGTKYELENGHNALKIGLTIDERIADGYYYSKSLRILKTLLEHPVLLDCPVRNLLKADDLWK